MNTCADLICDVTQSQLPPPPSSIPVVPVIPVIPVVPIIPIVGVDHHY